MKSSTIRIISLLLLVLMATGAIVVSAQDGDTLNLLYWQAPSTMNQYLAGGTKEQEVMSLVNEPLARYDPDGVLVPYLAADIPTLANGGVAEDLTSITWTLKEGLLWSDGTPVTSADVVFTGDYCMDEATGCSTLNFYANVETIEVVDDLTVKITFDSPKINPYGPFVAYSGPILQKAQFEGCIGANAQQCTEQNFAPIGTGPFVVEEFRPNDVAVFTANPNYRDEGKPFFSRLVFKGGGDAESAARAVLETGEVDYAWNLQVSGPILAQMEAAGIGTVNAGYATNVERLILNHANPYSDASVEATGALWMADGSNGHPFLQDPAVYKALSMAIDRNVIAEELYGPTGRATCNVINGPPANVSTANDACLVPDIDGANALLDEAGIVDTDGDGIREKDGVPLFILLQTSTNNLRQNTQALIKQWWTEIGVETELRNIDASVYFSSAVESPDTYTKFNADINMFTSGTDGTDADSMVNRWTCDQIPLPENNWGLSNVPRWCNPDYDALYAVYSQTAEPAARSELVKQLNDLVVQDGALIPLIYRASVSAYNNSIEGIGPLNGWDSELWNIADWTRAG